MTDNILRTCKGCGEPTSGTCWTDCGMSLCGAPLCSGCDHVREKYGWSHQPRNDRLGAECKNDQFTAALRALNTAAYAAIRACADTTEYPDIDRQALRQIARMTDDLVDNGGKAT